MLQRWLHLRAPSTLLMSWSHLRAPGALLMHFINSTAHSTALHVTAVTSPHSTQYCTSCHCGDPTSERPVLYFMSLRWPHLRAPSTVLHVTAVTSPQSAQYCTSCHCGDLISERLVLHFMSLRWPHLRAPSTVLYVLYVVVISPRSTWFFILMRVLTSKYTLLLALEKVPYPDGTVVRAGCKLQVGGRETGEVEGRKETQG